jgi:chromosomal replication initiation ATPase DnaA
MIDNYEAITNSSTANYLLLVSNITGIGVAAILSRDRKGDNVEARQLCMFFYKMEIGIVWAGKILHKSHSTVSHGYNTVQGLLEVEDKRTLDLVLQIKNLEENGKLT